MREFLRPIPVLVWKDILLELRSRDIVVSVLVFALLIVVVFNFALNITPEEATILAPGVFWVAFAFAGTLTMNRAFVLEKEQGGLEGLLLSPVSRDAIFLGKALASFLFMIIVEALLLPVFGALFSFSVFSVSLIVTILLATLGFATVGTLFSSIAIQSRSREIMLPILFFPVILPVIIAAVEASKQAIGGESLVGISRWLPLIAAFDAIYLVVCPWAFGIVMEE